jgi:hypothetical protein
MRGVDHQQSQMFSYLSREMRARTRRFDRCTRAPFRNGLNLKTTIVGVVAEDAPAYALSFEADATSQLRVSEEKCCGSARLMWTVNRFRYVAESSTGCKSISSIFCALSFDSKSRCRTPMRSAPWERGVLYPTGAPSRGRGRDESGVQHSLIASSERHLASHCQLAHGIPDGRNSMATTWLYFSSANLRKMFWQSHRFPGFWPSTSQVDG